MVKWYNLLLVCIFDDIGISEYPFWENEDGELESFIIENKMPEDTDDIFSDEAYDKMNALIDEYYEKPNNGSVKKSDAEMVITQCFPMVDIKKLIDTIEPEYIVFGGSVISFQCSSKVCDGSIICGAYAQIEMDNSFYDWHNN